MNIALQPKTLQTDITIENTVPQNTPLDVSDGPVSRDTTRVCAGLREALIQARNDDGGWGYTAGKRSRLEPTCWALLALAAADRHPVALDPLRSWPRHGGWLVDLAGVPPNQAFNALAALVLLQDSSAAALARPVWSNLLSAKGRRYGGPDQISPDDGRIQAWSWVEDTASWVEPTAWSLLLLKRLRRDGSLPHEGAARIEVGEAFLFDRMCTVGGWNYGNKRVYGHDLWPYVPTTALALLAMQDRPHLPAVQRGLEQMQEDLLTERSVLALALAHICLIIYRRIQGASRPTGGSLTKDLEGSREAIQVRHQLAFLADRAVESPHQRVLDQALALYALSEPTSLDQHLFAVGH